LVNYTRKPKNNFK